MQVYKKVITYDIKITDKEIKVIMECLKGCQFSESDCRDQVLALDLLDGFERLFGDDC